MQLLLFFLTHLYGTDTPIVVARDTTYITAPLRTDGQPDYEQYIRQLSRKGVTPDNNAAVLLFQALWPNNLQPEHFELMRAELGLKEIPSERNALQPLFGEANRKRVHEWRIKQHMDTDEPHADDVISPAVDHAWTGKQIPPLADWVEANKKPISLIVEASRRPRYYSPSPTHLDKKHDMLIEALLPGVQGIRETPRALGARAMRHVGENRLNEAWADLMAVHRLARLAAQGQTLIDQLVAIAIGETACRGTLALLSSDRLTPQLARQIKTDLAGLPNVSHVAASIRETERIYGLDGVLQIKQYGVDGFTGTKSPRRERNPVNSMSINWNVTLRRVNYWYDRLNAVLQIEDRQARSRSFARFEADLEADGKRLKQPMQLVAAVFSRNVRSELMAAIIANLMIPSVHAAIAAEDRSNTTLQLTRLAADLAVYRTEHRYYPAKLDSLVPALLPKLPTDTFGNPIVYKRTDDGYLLYSTGLNGVDDDGSNEWGKILAGRSQEELSTSDESEIPAGADDFSVRIPRPAFQLLTKEPPADAIR